MPLYNYNWPTTYATDRGRLLTEEQATVVILKCRQPRQDAKYAKKYGVTPACIEQIRIGRTWWKLRQRLRDEGLVKTGRRP